MALFVTIRQEQDRTWTPFFHGKTKEEAVARGEKWGTNFVVEEVVVGRSTIVHRFENGKFVVRRNTTKK